MNGSASISEHGLSLQEAIQALWPTNIFTTHTPVPAGNERFGVDLMQKYFDTIAAGTGFTWEEFIALGRENPGGPSGDLLHDRPGDQALSA